MAEPQALEPAAADVRSFAQRMQAAEAEAREQRARAKADIARANAEVAKAKVRQARAQAELRELRLKARLLRAALQEKAQNEETAGYQRDSPMGDQYRRPSFMSQLLADVMAWAGVKVKTL